MIFYIIGSLRNPEIPRIGNLIRSLGHEAFDDWYAAGPEADDKWKEYEQARGRTYKEALSGYASEHVFEFDEFHLNRADGVLLVMPAGRSGHIEFGYVCGRDKPGFVLMDTPDRWDVMYRFAHNSGGDVFFSEEEMIECLRKL